MAKRLAQDGIEVSEGLTTLNLQTAPELWPVLQSRGEAVDLAGLFRRVGLLWRGMIRLLCKQQQLIPRRTKIAVVDSKTIPLHAGIVGHDLGPVVPRIATWIGQAGIRRGNDLMRKELFITSGLEHGEEHAGQLLVLTLDILPATLVGGFMFQAEATVLPILDSHQHAVVVAHPMGAIP